jgi:IPT/TIG domain
MPTTEARQDHASPTRILAAALATLAALTLALTLTASASASLSPSAYRAENLCSTPRPGAAACLGLRLVSNSLTSADLKAAASRQASEEASGATPAVQNKAPLEGGLTPAKLHTAYSLPTEVLGSSIPTIAVVDAFNDPTAEADLGVYDKEYDLPSCTTGNGCFRKLNQEGKTSPLPANEGGWATEISLDVQMAHAICQGCHVMLVEAENTSFGALGAAVDAAVKAGATVVSNSYGGPEESGYSQYNAPYNHPGVVITASAGDCGYYNEGCGGTEAANFPASSPDVVAVGGTSLYQGGGSSWISTVWAGGGSGCSVAFTAPLWQSEVENFSATECGTGRSVADVAAVANPYTGVEVYDSTPSPGGYPTGWGIWGGTSVASPVVAAEFALAGGAHGVQYPASTLYSNIGNASKLYDVVEGNNGSCTGATACEAAHGYDGPTGVGSPVGLGAFNPASSPTDTSPPTISGTAEEGQTLTVSHGQWSNTPSAYTEQWAVCNSSGANCTSITGATGTTYKVSASYVGSTIKVQEDASNSAGSGSPAMSSATSKVISDVPVITSFTPTSGLTGTNVTITGTALSTASTVRFDGSKASFTVVSPTQIEATVPNGALVGDISVQTPVKTATSTGMFTPTLSVGGFSPATAAPGAVVTISGLGFHNGTTVSFHGVPAASVTYVSATKLKATVPAGVGVGAVSVTNSSSPVGTVSSATNFTTS